MKESHSRLSPADGLGAKQSETTVESVLSIVFIALFVQLLSILFVTLFTGLAPVFVYRFKFQTDFVDFFVAGLGWVHGISPYLSIRIVTPPPSILIALLLQGFSVRAASVLFLIADTAIIAASLWSLCRWFQMTRRESLLLFGIASFYFPVIFLLQRGNLDGFMLGLMLVSLFAKNRFLKALALSLSIGFKVYSILMLAPLMLAREWKRTMAVLGFLALLFLSFHSLFWDFVHAETRRSGEIGGLENLCPFGGVARYLSLNQAHAATFTFLTLAYLAIWIVSFGWMLFRNRNSDLTALSIYSFAWMLALPLRVFPYTGVLLLPLLALKSREMAEMGFMTFLDRLFLVGFCLVGFQQTAMSSYFPSYPHLVWLFDALNPLGTALVMASLALQSSR